ncbi:hypothetical protein [Bifidobacterium eulemuris]|uniref:Uncharacterized protein n=1 Tax=Bifidobacterium eulemuris TaxID=1765219 RepID=A0A261GA96_9BIFI|nr:hypothetical protein [Bifidobacterium eulemuris]OZG68334.1 hypothetical protein BEUL_1347 [Bifidobacterium eulemuris]QOL31618.1 hypothetical protein BE0216_03450 [Bifidobacterium eulemuris]
MNALPIPQSYSPWSGLAGNTVTPFDSSCPCHAAVQSSRDLIAVAVRSTEAAIERAATAIAQSRDISWQGHAATLFRMRLDSVAREAAALSDEIDATIRISLSAGAP